jgi:hypothetical protein
MKKIVEEIKKDYGKLKSLSAVADEVNNCIILAGARYRGDAINKATYSQIDYLISFSNVTYQSKSNLSKGNKWFLSACIDIVKKYPSYDFNVIL